MTPVLDGERAVSLRHRCYKSLYQHRRYDSRLLYLILIAHAYAEAYEQPDGATVRPLLGDSI
jgi:hypothetical protein